MKASDSEPARAWPGEAADGLHPSMYADDELRPVDHPRLGRTPGIVNDLLMAGSPQRRQHFVRGLLHELGFEWLAYGTEVRQPQGQQTRSFLTTYAHAPWVRRYFDEAHHEVDPRHHEAPRTGLPLMWDMADLASGVQARHNPVRAQRFLDDIGDSGIRSGVFFHVVSPATTQERTVISLMSTRPGRTWILDGVMGRALTLGLCLHDFISHHMQRLGLHAVEPTSALSSRQQDILQCLSLGQSDKQIANGLHLSTHTVDYHMRELRRHFDVRNRVQLVNAAHC